LQVVPTAAALCAAVVLAWDEMVMVKRVVVQIEEVAVREEQRLDL
tara:strand:- start:539 stop:673 length:135 start_codon:yes stop_codon:yes gene_type:complete